MLNVYCTGHKWSKQVCGAFAAGLNVKTVPPAPLLPGDVFMYGALRGLLPTLRQAQREGRTWFYADNGYFRAGKGEYAYFRITRNALQHDGAGGLPRPWMRPHPRWAGMGLAIRPWRKSGSHVIVCPPGRLFGATFGFSADEWLACTLAALRRHTDRELRVRAKMSWNDVKPMDIPRPGKVAVREPLATDLKHAWALVTHSSNSAVEALLAGVPVFCTERCASGAMSLADLAAIETPRLDGDRERWVRVLACNQWTLGEMRSGLAWKMLNERPDEIADAIPGTARAAEIPGHVAAAVGA